MGTFIRSSFTTTDTAAPKIEPVYARDTFSGGNGTLGKTEFGGLTWTWPSGTWNTHNGVLASGNTTGVTPADCYVVPKQKIAAVVGTINALGGGNMAGLLFRAGRPTTNVGWVYYATPAGHVLAKRTAGDSFTVVEPTAATVPPFAAGEQLRVQLTGNRIIASVNGKVTHDVTDATYAEQTAAGFTTRMATSAAPAIVDDFALLI